MSRDLQSETLYLIDGEVVYPFFAVTLNFDEPIYMWTGSGSITHDSKTFLGVGDFLAISSIEEASDMSARGARLELSGIPSELIYTALTEEYQGKTCEVFFGLIDKESQTPVNTTFTSIFSGHVDQMNVEIGPDTSIVEVLVENKLIDLERPRVARYTSGYQKSLYSYDKGFDFIEDLQDKAIVWGRSSS